MLFLSASFIMLSGPTNAFTLDDVDIPPNTHTLDISVLESTPSYDVAGLTWLPKIKDSEVGPTGNDMGYNANQGADCSGYKYSTSNCKANNQEPLGTQCLYNHKLFDNCGCNTAKFPISQTECSYSGSLRSQAWLLGDNVCKDQRYSNRMYGKKCLCTSANFPHTSTATCSSPQTLLDDASKCSYQGVTRYERCKCDTAAGKYEFSSDKGYGWDCSKCSDAYGDHYKCTPKPCVEGSTSTSSCGTNEQLKDTGYKSGDAVCKICEIKSNCGFFKNANGTINIPDSACSWDTYGHTATVNVPSGKSYSNAWIRMWGDSTVNGDFTTATLIPGLVISNGGAYKQPRTITYKGRVTVTDTIRLEPGITTVKFEKGVCGNYKCEVWEAQSGRNQWRKLRDTTPGNDGCPYKASDCDDGCKNYFVNSDGTFSIPDGKCGWDAYGHTATISSGKPLNAEYETVWVRMWGPATIKNEIKTKNLRSGVVVSNVGSWNDPRTITFKDKVTISGVLETDPDVTTTKFDGGIYGNYVCKHIKAASGANKTQDMGVIQPGEKGCPCSMDRFAQNASTCNGILAGASCGGKYEKCETVENCATYDANRTQCTKCNSGYNLENGQCVKTAEECSVGKILYSDGTCSSKKDSSKTVTGIVLSLNPNLVMSTTKGSSDFGSGQAGIATSFISGMTQLDASSAANDMNGKNNTALIKAHSNSTGYQYRPVNYALDYSSGSIGKGSWFIPGGGQAKLFGKNKTLLNQGLSAVGASTIGSSDKYWTSSMTRYTGANPNTQNTFVYDVAKDKISSYSGGHTNNYRFVAEFTPASK